MKNWLHEIYNKIRKIFIGEDNMKNRKRPFPTKTLSEVEVKVIDALENPKFKWRTLKGVSKEIQLDLSQVETAIELLKDDDMIVIASTPTENGDLLYTSRNRYKFNKEFRVNRLLSVLSDKVK